ncbi:hypothetical protein GH733_012406, partial [Mirounga leonina]
MVKAAPDGQPLDHVSSELSADKVPKATEHFRTLRAGAEGFGSRRPSVRRIIPGFVRQGGDVTCHHGLGRKALSGEKLEDANFILKHTGPGIRPTANTGPDDKRVPSFSPALPRLSGWMARCGLWQGVRGPEYCGSPGAPWVQTGQEQQGDRHCCLGPFSVLPSKCGFGPGPRAAGSRVFLIVREPGAEDGEEGEGEKKGGTSGSRR